MHGELRIVFAGGGTGGHVFPAINMAKYLKKQWGANCLFIGTRHGIESRKVPQAGFVLKYIWISGFHRRLNPGNVLFPLKLLVSSRQSKNILDKFKPDLVIGTGGYISGPVLRQAVRMKIPTAIQEQNSYPGVTTRLLAPKVDRVFLAYEESLEFLKGVKNYMLVGNPLQEGGASLSAKDARRSFNLQQNKFTLLVFGGSQGARSINRAFDHVLQSGELDEVQIIWQTGETDFNLYREKYQNYGGDNIRIYPFIDRMDAAYAASSLAVCRAGAMTVTELARAGLPSVFIPYPHAAADHQFMNAKTISDRGAAVVISDKNGMTEELKQTLKNLIHDSDKILLMRKNMKNLHQPDATVRIAGELQKLLTEKKRI